MASVIYIHYVNLVFIKKTDKLMTKTTILIFKNVYIHK